MLPEQRRADRRQRLLAAALEVFTTHGYHTARIEQLCSRASVSTRNFYEEFASKEDVLLTLHDQINSAGLATVTDAMKSLSADDPAPSRINCLLEAFWDAVSVDPRLPRLAYLEAPGATPAMQNQHQQWVHRWAALIESEAHQAAERGIAPERDYRLIAVGLVGSLTGLLRAARTIGGRRRRCCSSTCCWPPPRSARCGPPAVCAWSSSSSRAWCSASAGSTTAHGRPGCGSSCRGSTGCAG
jgi:AcrR family transcriptional regulator